MVYAIFTKRHKNQPRRMHAVAVDTYKTVCGLPIGIGSSLYRDGDYHNNVPCGTCWSPS